MSEKDELLNELQELVESWDEFAEVQPWSDYGQGVNEATKSSVKELQEIIDKYD